MLWCIVELESIALLIYILSAACLLALLPVCNPPISEA